MTTTATLWQTLFRLENQLLAPYDPRQHYSRLISDYTACCCRLATLLQQQPNPLLQEWCLRQGLFNLAKTAMLHKTQALVYQCCLDQLYRPMLALNHLYNMQRNGPQQQLALQASLNQIFYFQESP